MDNAQEALDTALIAYRVAEDRRIFLPCGISCDGAFLTHSQALVKIPSQEKVNEFLPRYNRADLLLHPDNPITVAPQANEDWVMEIRRQNYAAMERTTAVIKEAYADFERIFGRSYGNPFFEEYMTEDADIVLHGHGHAFDPHEGGGPPDAQRREESRVCAPALVPSLPGGRAWPSRCGRFKAVGVVDRDYSFGSPYMGGVVANEVRNRALLCARSQAAGAGFHLRPGRPRGDRARCHPHDRVGIRSGGGQDATFDAVDRAARVIRFCWRASAAREDE